MFLFTVTKPGLRQAGALALCAVCLSGTVAAAVHFSGRDLAVETAAGVGSIETTQDIAAYFTGYGFEVDLATAAVDKVKIPRKWDDSFTAFDQVVGESGLSLAGYKGKTVEKWTALCPARSDGENDTYCVLLVYKGQPVGAYLLQKPSGEVSGLVSAAQTAADIDGIGAQDTAEASADVSADAAETPDAVPAGAEAENKDAAEAAAPADTEAAETAADVYDESVFPTE